jgi:lipopolysaccharide/colanic/teichoic acid biosynthesis glycosyltransferase
MEGKCMKPPMTGSVVCEALFRRLLSLERRRCERSESRFGLLLVELEPLQKIPAAPAIENIAPAIAAAMRETDITGWYEDGSTLGVILTALNETERDTLETAVVDRVKSALTLHLSDTVAGRVRISCHLFPEDDLSNHIFYSDEDQKRPRTRQSMQVKRSIDVAGSLAALIVLLPVFAVIAALIKSTSKGPVFFRQKRVGQFGREFTFLKFRSMYNNNDPAIHREYVRNLIAKKLEEGNGSFKIKNDPRVTRIGRLLRKTSLDELPQFVNVLRGDMSLVGPRPPIRYEFESYSLWHRRRVLSIKPGITGEWQVSGRSRTTFDEMVRMDLRYIEQQSVWLDLKILLKTPLAVISGDGAY